HTVCMETWVRIDLVQAIATSARQKRMVLRSLVKNFTQLLGFVETISCPDDVHFYKKLMRSLYFSFSCAFPSCKNHFYRRCHTLLSSSVTCLQDRWAWIKKSRTSLAMDSG